MVYLTCITTKSGDGGTTSLGDGTRVAKTHPRINAIGSVDELNATIGLAATVDGVSPETKDWLQQIQNDLFDAGAELCFPPQEAADSRDSYLGVTSAYITRLEEQIEAVTGQLQPLDSFVLPGGTPLAAGLHLARTVCRRAERDILTLAETESVSTELRLYFNRLSDLLFQMARAANDGGHADILWKPGRSKASSGS